jgi:hypothetical protein
MALISFVLCTMFATKTKQQLRMKFLEKILFALCIVGITISCGDDDTSPAVEYSEVPPYYPIDFEPNGFGATWTWTVFENGSNDAVEFVNNPSKNGINKSSTVAKITALQRGAPYVGCETKHGTDIGGFTFDETNKTVKIMVYKSVISDVGLKFAEFAPPGVGAEAQAEIKVANTKINEWEELTFDLSGSIGKGVTGIVDQIIIFPDFQTRTSDNVVYFDNITFGN